MGADCPSETCLTTSAVTATRGVELVIGADASIVEAGAVSSTFISAVGVAKVLGT
jgi:hypothetical protein